MERADVDVRVDRDLQRRQEYLLLRWRGADGQDYGLSLPIPPGSTPNMAPEPAPKKAAEATQDFLTDLDRKWIDHHMSLASWA